MRSGSEEVDKILKECEKCVQGPQITLTKHYGILELHILGTLEKFQKMRLGPRFWGTKYGGYN